MRGSNCSVCSIISLKCIQSIRERGKKKEKHIRQWRLMIFKAFQGRPKRIEHEWINVIVLMANSSTLSHLLGALTKSQFPVFTIYAQKTRCLKQKPCERAWCIDRVQGYALRNHVKRSSTAVSRQDCYEKCFSETDFLCRWVSINVENCYALRIELIKNVAEILFKLIEFVTENFKKI